MKKLSLLLVLAFLLSAVGSYPVFAQDQAPQYGYIALLSEGYDASQPREILSRESFNRLLPDLMKAKRQGIISDFAPDLYGGFVKVTLAGGGNAGQMDRIKISTDFQEAVTPPPAKDLRRNGAGNAVTTPNVYMHPYSSCFSMYDIGSDYFVKGTLTYNGKIIAIVRGNADSDGYFWSCFNGQSVIPGYAVKLQTYNTSGTLKATFTSFVPRITFLTADMSQAIVTGTASGVGKTFVAGWYHPKLNSTRDYEERIATGTVSSTNGWKVDFGTEKLHNGDQLSFDLAYTNYFNFSTWMDLPSIYCYSGGNYCFLSNFPNKAVTMSITHAGKKYTFSGKTDGRGRFSAELLDANQEPIYLTAGDVVTGTGAYTLTIPLLTAIPNRVTDKVTGMAPKYNFFWSEIYIPSIDEYDSYWAYANGMGNYSADFSALGIPSDFVEASVYFMDKFTGNTTYYSNWSE